MRAQLIHFPGTSRKETTVTLPFISTSDQIHISETPFASSAKFAISIFLWVVLF